MSLDGALVDTSFLISLVKPEEANHAAAKSYYKGCLERQIPLYLSTIVISEFTVKQAITDLGLRNYVVLPFNIDHAMKSGQLWPQIERDPADARTVVKDDVKLIAQCACEGISHLFTGDRMLARYLHGLRNAGQLSTLPIMLRDDYDEAWFTNGQRGLSI
jgi:predicted nucleic acid-binding protein